MNNFNLPPDKMNQLLKMAGKQLGQDPETLKSSLEQGDAGALMNSLDPASREKVSQVLNDPKALEEIMKNDQIKALMKKLMGGRT